MDSFKTLLFYGILSLAATAAADNCPQYWGENSFKHNTKCCYGNMLVEDRGAFCCVYDVEASFAEATATASNAISTTTDNWSAADDCFTKIPFTASDYSSQVSLASVNVRATTTGSSTSEATSTGTNSDSSSGLNSASATSTPNVAMPVATAKGMVLGGAAAAVVLLL